MRMIWKLKSDQKDLIPARLLVRMYCKMLLHARVDSSVFVRVANEYGLCSFNIGPFQEDARAQASRAGYLVLETADQFKQVGVSPSLLPCLFQCG
jgi:hypothetical protein